MNKTRRPRVVTHNVSSLDGRVGLPGMVSVHRDERWRAMAGDAATDMWALHDPQVVMEGSNSFVGRDAAPVNFPPARGRDLHSDFLDPQVFEGDRRFYAVVDSRGRVRWTKTVGDHGERLMILASRATPAPYLSYLRDQEIPYLIRGDDRVDLPGVLERLRRLGIDTVVGTGGGLLNGALLRAGLVDEVDIDFMPAIIGGGGAPILFDGEPLPLDETPVRLRLLTSEPKAAGGCFVRYAVVEEPG